MKQRYGEVHIVRAAGADEEAQQTADSAPADGYAWRRPRRRACPRRAHNQKPSSSLLKGFRGGQGNRLD